MKPQSKHVEGVVLGHAVKANKPKQMRTKRFTTVVIDGYLGGSLQIFAEGYIQLVGCETKYAVAIKNKGDIRVTDAQRIIEDLRETFPIGSKVLLDKTKYTGSNVTSNGPVFVLVSSRGTMVPENTKEPQAAQAEAETTVTPTGDGHESQEVSDQDDGQPVEAAPEVQ